MFLFNVRVEGFKSFKTSKSETKFTSRFSHCFCFECCSLQDGMDKVNDELIFIFGDNLEMLSCDSNKTIEIEIDSK